MLARGLRTLAWVAYGGLTIGAFVLAGYFSFNLFVRSGVTRVPDLVGLPEEEVEKRLTDSGLRPERNLAADRYDEEVAADQVLQQDPGPGSLVKRGSVVRLTTSLGPERLVVPDLQGMALQSAQVNLAGAGLVVGRTLSVYRPGALPGTVVDQEPTAGEHVGRATPVSIYLCADSPTDTFVMPDLTYRDFTTARRFFERRGFRLGSVKFEAYEGLSSGVVLRQFPLPGHPLHRRDVISLVVTAPGGAGV